MKLAEAKSKVSEVLVELDIAKATKTAHEAEIARLQKELVLATRRAGEATAEQERLNDTLTELNLVISSKSIVELEQAKAKAQHTYNAEIMPARAHYEEVSESVSQAELVAELAAQHHAEATVALEFVNGELDDLLCVHDEDGNIVEQIDRDELLERSSYEHAAIAVTAPTVTELSAWNDLTDDTETEQPVAIEYLEGEPYAHDETWQETYQDESEVANEVYADFAETETVADDFETLPENDADLELVETWDETVTDYAPAEEWDNETTDATETEPLDDDSLEEWDTVGGLDADNGTLDDEPINFDALDDSWLDTLE